MITTPLEMTVFSLNFSYYKNWVLDIDTCHPDDDGCCDVIFKVHTTCTHTTSHTHKDKQMGGQESMIQGFSTKQRPHVHANVQLKISLCPSLQSCNTCPQTDFPKLTCTPIQNAYFTVTQTTKTGQKYLYILTEDVILGQKCQVVKAIRQTPNSEAQPPSCVAQLTFKTPIQFCSQEIEESERASPTAP